MADSSPLPHSSSVSNTPDFCFFPHLPSTVLFHTQQGMPTGNTVVGSAQWDCSCNGSGWAPHLFGGPSLWLWASSVLLLTPRNWQKYGEYCSTGTVCVFWPLFKEPMYHIPSIASTLFFRFQGKTSQPWTTHQEDWNNTHSIGEKYFLFFFSPLKLKANMPTSISLSPMLFNKNNFVWRGTWEKGSRNWDDYMEFALSWNYIDPLLPWTDLYHVQVQQT